MSVFLRRVTLLNYKSIARCDVELGPLTFLVGVNGSGKSNFLDALRFTAEALRTSLDHAMRDRGGINEVRRKSGGHPNHFGLRLDFTLPSGQEGHYAFRIAAKPSGGFEVQHEECVVQAGQALQRDAFFRVRSGQVETSSSVSPAAAADRLFLVAASGDPAFRPVYDALSHMGFYSLNPDRMKDVQSADAGDVLSRDGSNLASVVARLRRYAPDRLADIEERLELIVPGVRGVGVRAIGPKETLEFRQVVAGRKDPWRFLAVNMSDGTLRALGLLVALFQSSIDNGSTVPLVGIEEPETALHPGASGILLSALREASLTAQVLVTSHSPDLLDDPSVSDEMLRLVVSEDGRTVVGPVDEATRASLRDHLFTAGELLRTVELRPEPAVIEQAEFYQPRLFDVSG
jgi:predicted ATPase